MNNVQQTQNPVNPSQQVANTASSTLPVESSKQEIANQEPQSQAIQDIDLSYPVGSVETKTQDNGVKLTQRNLTLPQQNSKDISEKIDFKLSRANEVINRSTTLPSNFAEFALILNEAISSNASDIHLSVGYRAILRIDGNLKTLQTKILTNEQIRHFVEELVKDRHGVNIDEIESIDLSYSYQNTRFRVNVFKQLGNYSIVMRLIPTEIKTIEQLGLPQILKKFSDIAHGLILVTGPTGSGKSTSIASILNLINLTRPQHIITLEDPVEYVFPKGLALVDQREFGIDFSEWPDALKAALRQDPDVVLVGEMRDYETIASAITLSETGHLVFATLHTNSASQAIDRIIDVFPAAQQTQVRAQLASVLAAVVSQRLVPLQSGGRKAAMEILLATAGIRNAIREAKTQQIDNMIQTGQELGMITLEQSLVNMVRSGQISVDTAKSISSKPDEIDLLINNS